MALEFYVEQADRSPHSGVANESIYAGELVFNGGEGVDVLTFADAEGDGEEGLARYDAEAMAAEWEEDIVEEVYDEDQRVQYQPFEDSAVVRIRTIEETTEGVTSAPDIGHQDVVGIVDEEDEDAPDSPGRIVEEGYVNDENDDDTDTTFDRDGENFKAVGVAYRPESAHEAVGGDDFDDPVRVVLFSEVKA